MITELNTAAPAGFMLFAEFSAEGTYLAAVRAHVIFTRTVAAVCAVEAVIERTLIAHATVFAEAVFLTVLTQSARFTDRRGGVTITAVCTVMFVITASAAVFTAVVAAVTDIVVTASLAAVFTFHVIVPCMYMNRTGRNQPDDQCQAQKQAEPF